MLQNIDHKDIIYGVILFLLFLLVIFIYRKFSREISNLKRMFKSRNTHVPENYQQVFFEFDQPQRKFEEDTEIEEIPDEVEQNEDEMDAILEQELELIASEPPPSVVEDMEI